MALLDNSASSATRGRRGAGWRPARPADRRLAAQQLHGQLATRSCPLRSPDWKKLGVFWEGEERIHMPPSFS